MAGKPMKSLIERRLGLLLFLAVVFLSSASVAQDYRVVKGDLLRVSVFQWPEYSGESRVDDSGTISLPALGRLTVDGLTLESIERQVIEKLSTFSEIPNVRVVAEVAEYRPFSVLGAVNEPGRYPYTGGMTVLDAVAVAGGFLAPSTTGGAFRRLVDLTEGRERLDVLTFQLWVATARRSRLLAEKDGLEEIVFPAELIEFQTANEKVYFSEREEDIFAARRNSIESQIDILKEQTSILKNEIRILERHRVEIKRSVSFLDDELKNQSSLLDKGLARKLTVMTVKKQLTDMQGEYRRSVVSTMKAKKNLSDVDTEILLIQNKRRAEISNELISVESDISILLKRIEYQKALWYDSAVSALGPNEMIGDLAEGDKGFDFVILRSGPRGERSVVQGVTESMPIMSGDILKVLTAR
jgi:protein involved in polysaccharide export with SLBB domain